MARLPKAIGALRQQVAIEAAPSFQLREVDLDVALQAYVPIVEHERLVDIDRIRKNAPGICWQFELLIMPMERCESPVWPKPFDSRFIEQMDIMPADFGVPLLDLRAQCMRHDLATKAMADDRHLARECIAQ
jgi:hypothetical protein